MIWVQLSGGLGNQLFQWQAGLLVALRNKTNLCIDVREVQGPQKDPGILSYQIPDEIQGSKINMIRRGDKFHPELSSLPCLAEPKNEPNPSKIILSATGKDFRLEGYFQSAKISEELKLLHFNFSSLKTRAKFVHLVRRQPIVNPNTTVIHVRRGDYTHASPLWGLLSEKYYLDSLDVLTTPSGAPALIFSDDPDWVKSNFNQLNRRVKTRYIKFRKNQSVSTLKHMSTGSKFILGNSTFSWWAGYLSETKEVAAPRQFYRSAFNNLERYPVTWNLVDSSWL